MSNMDKKNIKILSAHRIENNKIKSSLKILNNQMMEDSLKDSLAFLTPELSAIKSGGGRMSFNCFSNLDVSADSVPDNIRSHSQSILKLIFSF